MRHNFALSAAQKIDARAAFKILDGTGISLVAAARLAVQGRRAVKRIHFADAVNQFVHSRLTNGNRDSTVAWYQKLLANAERKFGESWFDEIDRASLFTWLKEQDVSEHTRAGMSRALRAVWRWGLTHEPQLVAVDITPGLRTDGPRNEGDAKFLTVEQSAKLLADAGPYRSALALMLFAGVRPEEVAGDGKPWLTWKQVDVVEKAIRVPAEVAKTRKPRIIEGIPETLWAWLDPEGTGESVGHGRRQLEARAIAPAHVRQIARRGRELLGEWPRDVTRHTFATYALALTGDAGKVATWLGHEGKPTLLHRDYKGLARKVDAEKFFAQRPAS